ncbi:hypothetical protein [Labrenzia sp. DG1229]|uniref:hypothetical protein n=1 Tax=Labrenzia sp. DG1229 TaxID=681847 RepID=UPI00048B73C9|nr:hypothetical protein [Labrenzia sp. DG1229]
MEWTADVLPQGRMSDELLNRLLAEFKAHNAEITSLEPYLNNEPFLDKRFLSTLRQIRTWFEGNIEVSTNASLLTPDISRAIVDERLVSDFRFSRFWCIT